MMRRRILASAGALLALFAIDATWKSAALAAERTISWTLPTHYTDDSPIDNADRALMTTSLQIASGASGPWADLLTSNPGDDTATFSDNAMTSGRVYFIRAKSCMSGGTTCSEWCPTYVYRFGSVPSPYNGGGMRGVFERFFRRR